MKVYWIHCESHTDIRTQGYVGVTKRDLTTRLQEHGERFPSDWIHEVVFEGTFEECLVEEHRLRPEPNIGENKSPGGLKHGWREPNTNTPHKFRTDEHNAKIGNAMTGNQNGLSVPSRKVIVEGAEYRSITFAAKCLGTTNGKVYHRCNSSKFEDWRFE